MFSFMTTLNCATKTQLNGETFYQRHPELSTIARKQREDHVSVLKSVQFF